MPKPAGVLSPFRSFARIAAALLSIVALAMGIPLGAALAHGESPCIGAFLWPMGAALGVGVLVLALTGGKKITLSARSGLVTVSLCWLLAGILGAFPFVLTGSAPQDALFESLSGFTTTGATIFREVTPLPVSLNLWRCLTHWLGGMGIVALTVAILPLLGGSGFLLIKAETTGPEKGKITPKIAETAKILWLFYFGLTALQTVLLMALGMDFTDALAHAFSTMGTGGFSTRTESIAFYRSPAIEAVCVVFMFLAGVNFSLYFSLYVRRYREIAGNSELKAYCALVLAAAGVIALVILPEKGSPLESLRYALFQALSLITTTGFITDDFTRWRPAAQMVLFFLMFAGGCAGSTAGGVKVIRWVILGKQAAKECKRTLHPQGVFTLRVNGKVLDGAYVFSSAAFIAFYLAVAFAVALTVSALERIDGVTALTSALSMIGNIGPAFGAGGYVDDFASFSAPSKLLFCFVMLLGRLELYAALIVFFPVFWRRRA